MSTPFKHLDQLLVVIVLYKATLTESNSYLSILEGFRPYLNTDQRIDLIVINNGPLSKDCIADKKVFELHYVEQLDNPGVSKAYNIAGKLANYLKKHWLLLLDQDTHLPQDFWEHYVQALILYPGQPLYAPKLQAGKVLASPCGYRFYRGYVLRELASGINLTHGMNVLNSGLLIDIEAFYQAGGYNESVPLYFSDFVFFDRLKKVYPSFVVVETTLSHDLSSSDYSSQSTAMYRFTLYCQGAYAASEGEFIRSALYFITVGARSLVMGKRFSTLAFTKIFLRIWFHKRKR